MALILKLIQQLPSSFPHVFFLFLWAHFSSLFLGFVCLFVFYLSFLSCFMVLYVKCCVFKENDKIKQRTRTYRSPFTNGSLAWMHLEEHKCTEEALGSRALSRALMTRWPWPHLRHSYTLPFKIFPQLMGKRWLLRNLEYQVLSGKKYTRWGVCSCKILTQLDLYWPVWPWARHLISPTPVVSQFRGMVLRVLSALKSSSSEVSDWILEMWGKPSVLLAKVDLSDKIMDRRGIDSKLPWGRVSIFLKRGL